MKRAHSTTKLADDTGSTEPEIVQRRIQKEATKIRELWKTRNWQDDSARLVDSACLCRHKSLVLSLAVDDYTREREKSKELVPLSVHCRQYSGLGEPLEHSIYRRLEVQQFLDEYPDLLDVEHPFEWPDSNGTFLNFRVLEELGRGAMARVYLCEQLQLGGRSAVVKIELGESENEPSLLGKLRHPNITPVYWADYDQSLDASYLCMPFFGRSTLVDLIKLAFRDGLPTSAAVVREAAGMWIKESDSQRLESLSPRAPAFLGSSYITRVVRLAVDLADALACVHSEEIIHGDIKPSNVLLSPTGRPFLLDFNLGRNRTSRGGPAGGTLAYMAPEQLQTIADESHRSNIVSGFSTDIYSFGAVLYELFSGSPPCDLPAEHDTITTTAREILDRQKEQCPSVGKLNPDVGQQLAELIDSCLAFDQKDRPPTMREVCDRLTQNSRIVSRGRRHARKHPARTWLIGLAIGGAIVVASIAYWSRPPLTQRLYSQAVSAREAGDLKTSVVLLEKVLARDSNFHAARLCRARCNVELAEYTAAQGDLRRLVGTTDEPSAMAYYAYCLNLAGNPDAAVLWYQATLKHGSSNSTILNNLGVSLLLQSKPKSHQERIALAIPVVEEALRLNPDSAVIRMNALLLADSRLEIDATEASEDAVEHANWLSVKMPDHASVWKKIYMIYRSLSQRGLIEQKRVETAFERYQNCSTDARIPRFLDPLAIGDSD